MRNGARLLTRTRRGSIAGRKVGFRARRGHSAPVSRGVRRKGQTNGRSDRHPVCAVSIEFRSTILRIRGLARLFPSVRLERNGAKAERARSTTPRPHPPRVASRVRVSQRCDTVRLAGGRRRPRPPRARSPRARASSFFYNPARNPRRPKPTSRPRPPPSRRYGARDAPIREPQGLLRQSQRRGRRAKVRLRAFARPGSPLSSSVTRFRP